MSEDMWDKIWKKEIFKASDAVIRRNYLSLFENLSDEPIKDYNGKPILILGTTGSGKSNTVARFCEELLKCRIPFVIVDIENEYHSLSNYEDGGKYIKQYDRTTINKNHCAKIVNHNIINNYPMILNCQDFETNELYALLDIMFRNIMTIQEKRKLRGDIVPYFVIIEEAHLIMPQREQHGQQNIERKKLKQICFQLSKRGRKYGIYPVYVSQRPSDIDKNVVTQARIQLLHSVKFPWDIEAYQFALRSVMEPREVAKLVPVLTPGECYYINEGIVNRVLVKLRQTQHVGSTPEFPSERKFGLDIKDEEEEVVNI